MLSRWLMMKPAGTPTAALIVSFGESNSGGYALNSDAASWEVAARPEIRFWNVNTSVFEDMDIGANNNLDHSGLNNTTHGWELGLANRVRQGYFGDRTVHYVQTGQGASTVSQWNVGGAYWTKFLSRVTAAKAALSSVVYTSHVWISLGINDAIAATNDATFKTALQEIIARIKTELPGCKVYIATLPPVNGTYTTYSTRITEIASEDSANVQAVSVTSPVTLDMRDANHWSYRGMKRLASRMVDATLTDLSLSGKGFTWSASEDANWVNFSAINQHASVASPIDVTVDGFIASELGGWSDGQVVALDAATNQVNWSAGSDAYYGAFYAYLTAVNSVTGNATGVLAAGISPPCWGRLRWYAANDDLTFETSTDGGTTWTVRRTYSGVLASQTVAYVKALSAVGAAYMDVWRS